LLTLEQQVLQQLQPQFKPQRVVLAQLQRCLTQLYWLDWAFLLLLLDKPAGLAAPSLTVRGETLHTLQLGYCYPEEQAAEVVQLE
jgi:hypothetical protein